MRLLIVTPWPLRSPGGGQRLARAIAEALAERGLEVVVAAGSGLTSRSYDPIARDRLREVRLPLVPEDQAPRAARPPHDFHLDGLEALAAAVRPDAMVFTPHYSSCARQARAAASRLQIRFVICPAIHLDHAAHTSAEARAFYRSADALWCLSDLEHEWLLRRCSISAERVATLCYPPGEAVETRPQRRGAGGPIGLLTVGAFTRHKQVDHQVRALDLLRRRFQIDARLTIAGARGDARFMLELHALIDRVALGEHVDIAADCDDDTLARLHQGADAFLFTSRSESFAIAVAEAIASRTFPIVYPHPVYRTLVESAGFGRVAARATAESLAWTVADAAAARFPADGGRRAAWLAGHSHARFGRLLARSLDALTLSAARC